MPQAKVLLEESLDPIIAALNAASKTILYGTVNPTNDLGKDGDFYNKSNTTWFGPKAGGVWPLGISIVGQQGPTGAQGPQGNAGPKGDQGDTGLQGPPGLSALTFLGTWNAATNTPTLTTTPAVQNSYYTVSVAGTSSVTGTSTAFAIGDRIISSGTAWYRVAAADIAKLTPTSYSTPPSNDASLINDIGSFVTTGALAQSGHTYIVTNSTHGRALYNGYVGQFRVELANDDVTRVVRFYVLKDLGSGSYQCTYDSGAIAAPIGGITTFTPALGDVPINANDVIACYILPSSTANSIRYRTPEASNTINVTGALTLGNSYSTTVDPTTRRYAIEATIVDRDIVASRYWKGKVNGIASLDSDARLPATQLPSLMKDQTHTETPVTSYLTSKGSSAIVRNSGSLDTYSHDVGGTIVTNAANLAKVLVNWRAASPGFAKAGLLTELRFGPVATTAAGATLQFWVVRPVGSISTGATSARFTVVAPIGEIDASVTGRWHVMRGLAIPVQAGDLIAFRGIGVSPSYRAADTSVTGFSYISANVSDQSLAGMTSVPLTTIAGNVGWILDVDIMSSSLLAINTPGGHLRLNSTGFIPNRIGKQLELTWQGKKIIWVGTSIPANYGATSYPSQAGIALDAQLINESKGSSGIVWNGTSNLSLGATIAELTAAFGAQYAQYSYETKLIGKGANGIVFDHGRNDSDAALNNPGTLTSTDPATFYGAFNRVINAVYADNPGVRIAFVTPPSRYSGTLTTAAMDAVRSCILALADKYGAPCLDLMKLAGFNATNNALLSPDTIHPSQDTTTNILTPLAYNFLKSIA